MALKIKEINKHNSDTCLVTFTSEGYTELTKNLLQSINKNDINYNLNIFCIDKNSFKYEFGYNQNKILFDDKPIDVLRDGNMLVQKHDNFADVMLKKFEIIYESLKKFQHVIYVDGDIVITKDFLDYVNRFKDDCDILFQNDKRPSKPNLTNLCAGFMVIKSNTKTKTFFDPKNGSYDEFKDYDTHDQTYINKNKDNFDYSILPLNKFPNGPHYYKYNSKLNPFIVHFNYLLGKEKIDAIKKYGFWYY